MDIKHPLPTLLLCTLMTLSSPVTGTWSAASREKVSHVRRSEDVSSLEQLVQQQAKAIQMLQAEVTALKNRLPSTFQPVAFTVRFSGDNGDHGVAIGSHAVLKFDRIVSNIGNGYSTDTGRFTAPVSGVYAFSLVVMSTNAHGGADLALVKGGVDLGHVWTEGATDIGDKGSTQVATHLDEGEQVWIQEAVGDAVRGSYWTVFTGYLLQAE